MRKRQRMINIKKVVVIIEEKRDAIKGNIIERMLGKTGRGRLKNEKKDRKEES